MTFQSTPSGGKATRLARALPACSMFQSTPSGGKATSAQSPYPSLYTSFNPRLPGGRRHNAAASVARASKFQSTPSGGKATQMTRRPRRAWMFQSTPSGGKATGNRSLVAVGREVSIHAFRGEGDTIVAKQLGVWGGFNPRLPGGRRHRIVADISSPVRFQSTPSGGKATSSPSTPRSRSAKFQSTPSGGKATQFGVGYKRDHYVSIHAFRGEGDSGRHIVAEHQNVSIHAFRGEGDSRRTTTPDAPYRFNPRLPGGRRRVRRAVTTHHINSFNPRLPGGRRPGDGHHRCR